MVSSCCTRVGVGSCGVFSVGWTPVQMSPSEHSTVGSTTSCARVPYTPTIRCVPAVCRHSHGTIQQFSSSSRQLTLTCPAQKTAVRVRPSHSGEKQNRT